MCIFHQILNHRLTVILSFVVHSPLDIKHTKHLEMAPKSKPEIVRPSATSEPSEPSEIRPEEKSKKQLIGEQEENPQVIAHRVGGQAADGKAKRGGSGGEKGDKVADTGFAGEKLKSRM